MAINFTTIGSYGGYPPAGKACNGYLFSADEMDFLVDFGPSCMSRLLEIKSNDISSIAAVVITHMHYDHMSDLYALAYYLKAKKRKIKLIIPQTPTDIYATLKALPCYEIIPLNAEYSTVIGDINITFRKAEHPIETYSVIMQRGTDKLVYTSDISNYWSLQETLKGATAVIGDAGTLQIMKNPTVSHVSVAELAMATPKTAKLYLAHLSEGKEDKILAEAKVYHADTVLVNE